MAMEIVNSGQTGGSTKESRGICISDRRGNKTTKQGGGAGSIPQHVVTATQPSTRASPKFHGRYLPGTQAGRHKAAAKQHQQQHQLQRQPSTPNIGVISTQPSWLSRTRSLQPSPPPPPPPSPPRPPQQAPPPQAPPRLRPHHPPTCSCFPAAGRRPRGPSPPPSRRSPGARPPDPRLGWTRRLGRPWLVLRPARQGWARRRPAGAAKCPIPCLFVAKVGGVGC